ncbi:MAG: DegQ family serine endoprotease [Bacteroidota bacterium]|nr:DegQ family serine endoprotease [Bacteroidota bacterium]
MKKFHLTMPWRVTLLVTGFVAGIAFVAVTGSSLHRDVQVTMGTHRSRALLDQFSAAFEEAAAKVNPSVVTIYSEQVTKIKNPFADQDPFGGMFGDNFFKRFFNMPREQEQTVHALGSGVIISKDGYILTNNHVVDHATKLTVTLETDSKKKYTAKVIGSDPQSDIAVIKIDADDLPAASLANSDSVHIGQWVIAVGNPFGLMHTVTAGIISAKGRSSVGITDYEDFIQTDASINPGNSGGALADLDGNVVGINTAIESNTGSNAGVGFAIPINMAKSIMEELVNNGKVTRGYLGIYLQDIDDNLAKALKLKTTEGALVSQVEPNTPAKKAGVKQGDIITAFNGTKIDDSETLRNLVAENEPGTDTKLTVLRNGNEKTLSVKLGERPSNLSLAANSSSEESTTKNLGLTVQNLTADLADQLGYKGDHGVVITDVTAGSAAEDAGLRKNDLIEQVNQKDMDNVDEFENSVKDLKNGDVAAFLVRRGQNTFYTAIQLNE